MALISIIIILIIVAVAGFVGYYMIKHKCPDGLVRITGGNSSNCVDSSKFAGYIANNSKTLVGYDSGTPSTSSISWKDLQKCSDICTHGDPGDGTNKRGVGWCGGFVYDPHGGTCKYKSISGVGAPLTKGSGVFFSRMGNKFSIPPGGPGNNIPSGKNITFADTSTVGDWLLRKQTGLAGWDCNKDGNIPNPILKSTGADDPITAEKCAVACRKSNDCFGFDFQNTAINTTDAPGTCNLKCSKPQSKGKDGALFWNFYGTKQTDEMIKLPLVKGVPSYNLDEADVHNNDPTVNAASASNWKTNPFYPDKYEDAVKWGGAAAVGGL